VLIAPAFSDEALELLAAKPNMRILEDGERRRVNLAERDIKRVMGGLLIQDRDIGLEDRTEMEVVTERKPSEAEWGEMLFAWKVCKHVRSNAIVLSNDLASVGIGAGQMSRVDSVRLAIEKARAAGSSLVGSAMASDAFFPFPDGPQLAIDAGVTAVIQPGGSVRDPAVVEAADEEGISMVFTHRRHFRHQPGHFPRLRRPQQGSVLAHCPPADSCQRRPATRLRLNARPLILSSRPARCRRRASSGLRVLDSPTTGCRVPARSRTCASSTCSTSATTASPSCRPGAPLRALTYLGAQDLALTALPDWIGELTALIELRLLGNR
jgi:hypothetical protein